MVEGRKERDGGRERSKDKGEEKLKQVREGERKK